MANRKGFIKVLSERLDTETGELQQVAKTVSYNIKVDRNFTKMHQGYWPLTYDLNAPALKLLLFMSEKMHYDNCLPFTGQDREKFARLIKVSDMTLKRAMRELHAKCLITRRGRSKYMVNPYLLTKGGADKGEKLREEWEELNPGWSL